MALFLREQASMFENLQIAADELPQVDTVDWQPMDARFRARQLSGALLVLLIIAAALGVATVVLQIAQEGTESDVSMRWLWLAYVLLAMALLAWPFFSVPRMRYALRERDIVYRHGVIWHTITAVPFNRIQHVEKSSTPLDRRFHIASLQLYTAGGSSSDLKIEGLPAKSAEKLRMFIIDKIGSSIEQS